MPTLDNINIALLQRGDQSHDVVIPGVGILASATSGHGQGGGPVGCRGGISAGGRGGGPTGGSGPSLAPSKGKQAHVILDNDEVSFDEDEPL
jgi:hypothetical protein